MKDILLEIDLSSLLQEKRDGGIVATGASKNERSVAILKRGRKRIREREVLQTLSWRSILAPFSRRRETVESWPEEQARWRGVEPISRESERRGRRRNKGHSPGD
jgi:hypothetical protein